MSSKLKGYCIVCLEQGFPIVYTMYCKQSYQEMIEKIQEERILGAVTGEKGLIDKLSIKAGKLAEKNPPSLREDLKKLGFTLPRAN